MLQDLTDEDEILKRAFQFFDKDGNGEISVQVRAHGVASFHSTGSRTLICFLCANVVTRKLLYPAVMPCVTRAPLPAVHVLTLLLLG